MAKAMWEISTQVFGVSQFSYADLASQVCEPNIDRVRLAVQRIAVTHRGRWDVEPLSAGPSRWRWRVTRDEETAECDYRSLREIEAGIDELVPPYP